MNIENVKDFVRRNTTEFTLLIVLAVIWGALGFVIPVFLSYPNLFNLARQTAVIGVVSIGMTLVMIAGHIDLSVGSYVAVSGVTVSLLLTAGYSIPVAFLLTLLLMAGLGTIVAVAVQEGGVPSFIAGLGMMSAARGFALLLTGGRIISGLPIEFTGLARTDFLGIPGLFLVLLALMFLADFVLRKTKFGRNLYTLGSGTEVAKLSGIRLRINTYAIFIINALISGLAGIMLAARLSSGVPSAGQMYELDAIAAVIIGGASLSGGAGGVYGTLLGALLMGTLRNGGNLLGLDPFYMQIATGVVVVVAVFVDQLRKRGE